jgi:hypothetical protein
VPWFGRVISFHYGRAPWTRTIRRPRRRCTDSAGLRRRRHSSGPREPRPA